MLEFLIAADGYFDVDAITQQLQIMPTRTRTNATRKELTPEEDRSIDIIQTDWSIETEKEESLDINCQFDHIFHQLKSKEKQLADIYNTLNNPIFRFCFVVYVENSQIPALYFSPETLSFIDAIQADIDIDFYIYS